MVQCSLDASPDAANCQAICGSHGVRLCLAHLQLSPHKEGAALVLSPDLSMSDIYGLLTLEKWEQVK